MSTPQISTETLLFNAINARIAELKTEGCTAIGFECFLQTLWSRVSKIPNLPTGTNARFVLTEDIRKIVAKEPNFANFITLP
jgi:hypothetical protein